jgi:hypothetical protein
MSSALTGNKIKDSYQALLKIGTNGSLDPTTPIVISDGLGNDTPLQVSGNRFNTQYLASNIGLDLNFSGNAYTIGDYDFTSTTTQLKVDVNGQQIITNSSGGYRGFNLDFFNDSYQFGDINGVTNANLFVIDNASSIIKTMKSGNDIGLKLDFANNYYEFGDKSSITGKVASLALVSDPSGSRADIEISGNALRVREFGNIWGGEGNMEFSDAIYENFGFTFDWKIENNDISKYPFYKNTIINTFGGVQTEESAMNNNFFANNSQLSLYTPISFTDNKVLSNCFVFGLTDILGSNALDLFSRVASSFNTNAVIFNGSAINIGEGGNHIFSVNASGLNFGKYVSGITVLGGDVYSEDNSIYVTAQHSLKSNKCGINFTGHHAKGTNNLSNVFGYFNVAFGTEIGQVQIEQKQLFANCPDGSGWYDLVDTFEDNRIFVENNTTYLIDAKFVSTNGDGSKISSGNWTLYKQYMICVDGSGNLSRASTNINGFFFNPPNQDVADNPGTNEISFQVRPDTVNSAYCWVRAEIVLHKIKAV